MYKRSLKLGKRNTGVIYYDLTNYFFEWEEEGGLVQFGHCKEGRPLPVVQMGLFMDHDGFPLAMCIEPGNRAETSTLKPMEEILKDKFGLSKLVVCTDGGLSSYDNRKNDSIGDRAFITVQSLKKLKQDLQKWALDSKGWHVDGSDKEYDISTLDEKEHYDTLFFKEIWDPTPMSTGETLEQRIIVTFSLKYRDYLAHVRNRQVTRAMALPENSNAAVFLVASIIFALIFNIMQLVISEQDIRKQKELVRAEILRSQLDNQNSRRKELKKELEKADETKRYILENVGRGYSAGPLPEVPAGSAG